MNFIDRINSWIVGRIRGSREIEFAGDVLSLGQKRLPLRTLTSAVGYQEDMYLGRRIALAMSFGDSSIVKISQDDWSLAKTRSCYAVKNERLTVDATSPLARPISL